MRRTLTALVVLTAAAAGAAACAGSDDGIADNNHVFVADVTDGSVDRLTDGSDAHVRPAWSPDGRLLAYVAAGSRAARIEIRDADGANRRVVFSSKRSSTAPASIAWSPDGRSIAFKTVNDERVRVGIVAVAGSPPRWLDSFRSGRDVSAAPLWSRDGRELLYVRPIGRFRLTQPGGVPLAPSVDARPLKLVSTGVRGGRPHVFPAQTRTAEPVLSPDGRTLLDVRISRSQRVRVAIVDLRRRRVTTRAVAGLNGLSGAAWSPDGRQIAFIGFAKYGDGRGHLYLLRIGASHAEQIVGSEVATPPAWSPDGRTLAFADFGGRIEIVRVRDRGRTLVARLPEDTNVADLRWSPDGDSVAFSAVRRAPED